MSTIDDKVKESKVESTVIDMQKDISETKEHVSRIQREVVVMMTGCLLPESCPVLTGHN